MPSVSAGERNGMDSQTLILVGAVVLSALVAGLGVLHQVAPLTENKVDDKIDGYGQRGMPVLLKLLDWFRARAQK